MHGEFSGILSLPPEVSCWVCLREERSVCGVELAVPVSVWGAGGWGRRALLTNALISFTEGASRRSSQMKRAFLLLLSAHTSVSSFSLCSDILTFLSVSWGVWLWCIFNRESEKIWIYSMSGENLISKQMQINCPFLITLVNIYGTSGIDCDVAENNTIRLLLVQDQTSSSAELWA